MMRQRKKCRDGIRLYRPSRKESHTAYRKSDTALLAAVRLAAVWFAAASWWISFASVFPMGVDTVYLYACISLAAVVLTLSWNLPVSAAGKGGIFALLCAGAVFWIRRHMEAAAGVINSAANAFLSVWKPEADPYPVPAVPGGELAMMTGLFLMPLLLIWSGSLHVRKGKFFSVLLIFAPAVLSLAVMQDLPEQPCWFLILSCVFFCSVYKCNNGQSAFVNGVTAVCILGVLTGVSALAGRPLEQYKEPPDGLYMETRESIRTNWIEPVRDYIQETQEKARKEEAKSGQPSGETDSLDETQNPDGADPPAENTQDGPDPAQTLEPDVHALESGLGHPLIREESPAEDEGTESGRGRADGLPDLNSLSRFRPDEGIRMTVSLDTKPKETFYYPEKYGGIYEDSRWREVSSDDAASEEYLRYPDTVPRLKELCDGHRSDSLDEVTYFIGKELKERTVYDYGPGAVPGGQDFAEYFLFENKKGFCVHFATAAALMYRICGFSSRYVQGYAVPASAFHRQEDGSYLAEVTGEMGHAWCEVYSDSRWIIKEHTLPYRGARPKPGTPAAADGDHTWVPDAAGWILRILRIAAVILVCLIPAAALLFFQAAVRRQYRYRCFRRRQGGAGIQCIYRAIYDAAVFHGMQKTDILNQKGFRILQTYRPEMDADAMEWLYKAVLETMFYEREVTREDLQRAQGLYQQFSQGVRTDLKPCRRFLYRYIKVL